MSTIHLLTTRNFRDWHAVVLQTVGGSEFQVDGPEVVKLRDPANYVELSDRDDQLKGDVDDRL